jgi:hypothetical protein
MKKFDLEDRLIKFAVLILEISEALPDSKGSHHIGSQLIRSGTAQHSNMEKRSPRNRDATLFTK